MSLTSELIKFAVETGEETAKQAGKAAWKTFVSSGGFRFVVSIVGSTIVASEVDYHVNKKMDEMNDPSRMNEKEKKSYTLKKKLINAGTDGAIRSASTIGLNKVIDAVTK